MILASDTIEIRVLNRSTGERPTRIVRLVINDLLTYQPVTYIVVT